MKLQTMLHNVFLLLLLFTIAVQQQTVVSSSDQQNRSPSDPDYHRFTYDATKFSPAKTYDYIIVGGGTAACPLAATLSERYTVLVLERGGDVIMDSQTSILYENNSFTTLEIANEYDSPAQNFVSEDGVPNARARVLGGGSMINFGFYSRADDYFYKNVGIKWDMRAVEQAYEWVENSIVTRPARINNWQRSTFNALIQAGVVPNNGLTFEHVVGTKISGSTFNDSGIRHGAVELLNKANPKNLQVLVHATVDRVLFSTSGPLATIGVRYHDSNGNYHEVHIKNGGEVILSAGALGSPQLLILSGLGPTSYLSSLNIPVVLDHPFIGQFMADHPRTGLSFVDPNPGNDFGVRVAGITEAGQIFESSPLNATVKLITGKVGRVSSSGSLRLLSASNISVSPSVRFNYYNRTEDIHNCENAVDVLRGMMASPAMEQYKFSNSNGSRSFRFIGPLLPGDMSDFETIASFCRETVATFYHIHGGCLINKVVDNRLKVIGVDSLRVVDASTFFNSPGTNPQATTMMLGRYIGKKILDEKKAN